MNIFLKYFIAWFPMLILAILNGTLREFVFKKHFGELAAHQLSTATLLILFAASMAFMVKMFPPESSSQAIWLGLFWMVLTLIFEFGFGRLQGNSWEKLLQDYYIWKGRIWVLVPIALAIGPYLFYRLFKN
ncbi:MULTISPECIES: hypothetical protein [Flavobacteriaceae]|uniref:hypothetical protein n=1 Tax=Flavobacteriaceae TaxID=49546 RepID=UPI00234AD511|nr:hypothetical protein [Muricauda sp. SP22]MDC6363012.1 hypothetical protein [Muricauda sp. SP22]